MKDAREAGGTAVIVRFMVVDQNRHRAAKALQQMLERWMQESVQAGCYIIGTPDVLAAEVSSR